MQSIQASNGMLNTVFFNREKKYKRWNRGVNAVASMATVCCQTDAAATVDGSSQTVVQRTTREVCG